MWSRLVIMCCFCLLLTGVSSCPKKGVNITNKINSVVKQVSGERVFFGYDESNINEVSADALLDVMEVLQDNPDAKVTLTGHTDNRGSHEYNLALGARRADAAKKFMVNCAPYLENRIKTASKGETEPLIYVEDDSRNSKYEKEHAKNRRVEFSFSGINRIKTVSKGKAGPLIDVEDDSRDYLKYERGELNERKYNTDLLGGSAKTHGVRFLF